ncbi:MAG: hypothetical protein WAQ05_01340, partial [Rubrivivax sp.]
QLQRSATGLQLEVQDSPFAAGWRAATGTVAPHAVCGPIRGMFTALASQVAGTPMQADETNCAATITGGSCRFTATPTR